MYSIKMTVQADSFENVKHYLKMFADKIDKTKFYRDLPKGMAGGGSGGFSFSVVVDANCPEEQKIKDLRAEADALEAKLNGGKS